MKYIFETRMQVRDYECDIEGIVNNANYLHYCEHTRHLFLKECGLSFAEMHEKGVDAVVARMSMQFKMSLFPGLVCRRMASSMCSTTTSSGQTINSVSVPRSSWSASLTAVFPAVRTMTGPSHPIFKSVKRMFLIQIEI